MHTLYTLGYSGWTPAGIKGQVDALGAALWDIRMMPWSKSPQWQQPELRSLLGASYAHVQALGNRNYKGGPIELANPEVVVRRLSDLLKLRPVILLCGCRDHRICHRTVAAEYLAGHLGCTVFHLYPHPKVKDEATSVQASMF